MANPPKDNSHCFKGMGLQMWRDAARGMKPKDTVSGPHGHSVVYETDATDGLPINNGGIAHPRLTQLHLRPMIRFMPASRKAEDGLTGNWWLDLDAYSVLVGYALNQKITLAKAAQTLLIVPQDWHDCGRMIVVRPNVPLQAYVGAGKPVALNGGVSTSPDARRQPGTQVFDAPPGTNIEQIFIPGERQFLPDWLRLVSDHRADSSGGAQPPL